MICLCCPPAICDIFPTTMARYALFVLKVLLSTKQTNKETIMDDPYVCCNMQTKPAQKHKKETMVKLHVRIVELKRENRQLQQELKEAKEALSAVKCKLIFHIFFLLNDFLCFWCQWADKRFGDPPPRWIRWSEIRMEDPQEDPLAVHCFCVCSGWECTAGRSPWDK